MTNQELEDQVKALQKEVQILKDTEAIKKLQAAYGYYIEHMMNREIVDLFADGPDVTLTVVEGSYVGKERVKGYFLRGGEGNGAVNPEFLHQVMQLSPVIDIAGDGKTAQGRWYGWGSLSIPWGKGVRQMFMNGIYEVVYIKEDKIWKIKNLEYFMHYAVPPDKGWVKADRQAPPAGDNEDYGELSPDIPAKYDLEYPSGYIFPMHFKHPVTGQVTSEAKRNAALKLQPNRYTKNQKKK